MHQVECLVDVFQRHGVRDEVVDVDTLFHVPVDDLGHVGAATGATEGAAVPGAAGHQLERTGGNFLTRAGHADDVALAPTLVRALECLTHDVDVTDALEAVVHATGHLYDVVDDVVDVLRVDEVGHAELATQGLARRVQVDADDAAGAGQLQALD